MRKFLLAIATLLLLTIVTACGGGNDDGSKDEVEEIETIVFADAGWDSIRFHNSVAQTIVENGFDYKTDSISGSTATTMQGLREGDIQVYTEIWTDNIIEIYEEVIEAGEVERLSTNFDDNTQGLYVPSYVIEGDPERDIEPLAPDLKTVEDLKKYPEVFEDPEDPGRGRVINAPSGWELEKNITEKFETYGLDETLNNFLPGSDAAIVASLVDAYNKGEGWVGYYWSPTAITAKYDLTLLEEEPYDEDTWNENSGTAFPPNDVVVGVHIDMLEQAPDVVEFLKNYETSSKLTEEALQYMEKNDASSDEAAIWWMNENEDLWTSWVSDEVAEKVKEAL